ncbi:GNAT family N-acetyltransferase [Aminicella lysinilytica]|uniref:Acetyltransferase (GNAT) family protein n=1 Tax=Aminicella lysinilytica TaxID=433323 RepID=A0A4R6Q2E9_9FIRM|nr:GNAT family N-acetyltransferase [Aminicella lysinilytica]NLD11524.1 GNAT family N-acetyltransferase [Clostridiales bacterium]TDP56428.1 acetyltransferase (GNAT) family protein [Aminicella lysinilytica]
MFTERMALADDCATWIEFNREFMAGEIKDEDLWNSTDQVSDEQFAETFSKALKAEDMISILIFEEDGKPVGFANLMTVFSVWTHGLALIIDDLYLREECRGKGCGRQAMVMIEEFAKERGCKRLQFQSEFTNPDAMKFYMAVGYTPTDMKFYVKYLDMHRDIEISEKEISQGKTKDAVESLDELRKHYEL